MNGTTRGKARYVIADPDALRRRRIVAHGAPSAMFEAVSLSEALNLTEAHRPGAVAVSSEFTGEAEFDMFLQLAGTLSFVLVVYGDRARDKTPQRLRKSVTFIPLGQGDSMDGLIRTLLSVREGITDGAASERTTTPADGPHAPSLIALGASTGGVSALETVLTAFPVDCPPTFVVQHIRAGFVDSMIRRLDGVCPPRVVPAKDAERPQRGHVYIAHDPERHLVLQRGEPLRCRLLDAPPRHGHRPSVDALFEAVAGRRNVAAALLTGMGADGAEALLQIKRGGGLTIAQNEATCVVYGMPRVAVELGAADHVLPLDRIASALLDGALPAGTAGASPRELAT